MRGARKKPPARERSTTRKKKGEAGLRTAAAVRDAITAAFSQEFIEETGEHPPVGKEPRDARVFLRAADALEPVLADAVRRRPSFLGRLAYGTAQLVTTLASEDHSSSRRIAEIASGSHVGLVFIDVVGFTAFTSTNGDEAAVALVKGLERLVETVCRRYEGEIVKHLGDGFLLAFPSASRAVTAAIALRDAVQKERARDPSFQDVRIAVHAGHPSLMRDDLIGHDVNLTARLLEHCKPGRVLVSDEAKGLAEKRLKKLQFSKAGKVKVRGVPEPVYTYWVEGG